MPVPIPIGEGAEASTATTLRDGAPTRGVLEHLLGILRGLGVGLAIIAFWSGGFLLAWLVVPYMVWREPEALARRRRIQRVVAAAWRWFHWVLERTTLYRCHYIGAKLEAEPAVYVANHPSLLDVTSIMCRLPHVCCVVRSSLIDNRLVGALLRSSGHVSGGDGSFLAGAAVLEALLTRLREGSSVLVFPEGTRSPKRGLHRFRRGAFEVARRANVPVVPLFLRCDPPALGKGTSLWEHPRRCPALTVHVGEAIDMSHLESEAACRLVEADFRQRLSIEAHREELS
jgi:1-acyl-sn-glycerol-3-phosphate acyltransferase